MKKGRVLMTTVCLLLTKLDAIFASENNDTVAAANASSVSDDDDFPDRWYELPLDHFNLFDDRTFKMRYLVNNEHFEKGGPLFVDVAGEWTVDGSVLKHGQMARLARKHKGMLVATEHRYYGKTLPFGEDFSTENLKYLQIEQALEDLAQFIEYYKSSVAGLENSTVVVHGCSYPGMLVTWLRLRFPNVVDIAYASSAPLGVGFNYPEFFEIVYDTYANVSKECIDIIKSGFNITQELAKTRLGLRTIRNALKDWDCGDIDKMNSEEIFGKMVQVMDVMHDPKDYERLGCNIVTGIGDFSAFHKLANFIVYKTNTQVNCANEPDPTGENNRTGIAWSYQTCTEMGTFQTLKIDGAKNPFAVDRSLEESIDECVKDFGGIVTEDVLRKGIERVTRRYGGKRPQVTKVVTVQGINDPWRDLAVLDNYTPEAPVLLIKGSHCIDVSERPDDDNELKLVRKKVRDIISNWLDQLKR